MRLSVIAWLPLVALFGSCGSAWADEVADWRAGHKIFKTCGACHSFRSDQAKFGPSLAGVIGRKAANLPDYPYSEAMKEKGAAGLVWNEETIDEFITAPKKFVPGTKMNFPGLSDPKDRRNVIAYVKRKAKR